MSYDTYRILKFFSDSYSRVLPAEREGFEPPEALTSTVFKTAAIDHSAISPWIVENSPFSLSDCKGNTYFLLRKYICCFPKKISSSLVGAWPISNP